MSGKKTALIVGGGSGIAAGAARKLAENGFEIAVMSSSGRGEALAKELGGLGFTGSNLVPDDLKRFVDLAMDRWGRIDAVVNGAGHGPKGAVLSITDADWQLGMEFYLLNVIRMTRLVAPVMQAQKSGSIVNISTAVAFEPEENFPVSAVFRTGRMGLAAFTKLFCDQYAKDNLRMNNVMPGFIDSLPEKEDRRARIPMGRYGTVDEAAELILFLASQKSGYITGQNIRIDGGLTRSV
jgi:NAD(P)-dependent dehydrogenase (short-subunit alcohol dehydrogenase family)